MTRKYNAPEDYAKREPYLLVMPKSKLVIGPFKAFFHAFLYWYKMDEVSRQDWFIVEPLYWPNAAGRTKGWITLDNVPRLRWSHTP